MANGIQNMKIGAQPIEARSEDVTAEESSLPKYYAVSTGK
jgi:hypothetical protein